MTRSQKTATEVAALIRARNPVLWVVTNEEARVERYLVEAAGAAGYMPRMWDVAQGVTNIDGRPANVGGQDPGETLTAIASRASKPEPLDGREDSRERGVWIMRDLPVWLAGPPGAALLRQLRNFARWPGVSRASAQTIIVLTPSSDVPPELSGHATVIEWPLPDRAEIATMVDKLATQYDLKIDNGEREAAIDAAVGLSGEEAQACFSKSLVQDGKINPVTVANEKKRVISREGVLEWVEPVPGGLDAVGGLENLKDYLMSRSVAYSPKAKAYGLPAPKGLVIVGISGCGKTLTAKAVPTAWRIPLVRLDFGALKSKFVGQSEGNLRKALKTIEAIGRCVVWVDEVEKAMQGATSGSADGGVSSDALGTFLTWMQERAGEAFVICTANDLSAMPPELLRKGRFDELFWVDLPNDEERVAVLLASLRTYKRTPDVFKDTAELAKVAKACSGFTGSEIAAIVPDALFAAFADNGREINADDLLKAAATVVPLSKTAEKKITKMREDAQGRFRPATKTTETARAVQSDLRVLDMPTLKRKGL